MKYFIPVFLALFAVSARAQITLEHTYYAPQFGLVEVDSNQWKYIVNNGRDSIFIFNLDHSLDRTIVAQLRDTGSDSVLFPFVAVVAKNLFDLDGKYEVLIATSRVRILREDGSVLLNIDGGLQSPYNSTSPDALYLPPSIKTTDQGTKMVIALGSSYYRIYSLPGKLPGCTASSFSGVTPSAAYNPSLPTSAYPNPSSGLVRIAYQLPAGVASGEVILTDESGREVKRYRVTNAFSDLEIQAADLPSGSYFYRVVTREGESPAERIVLDK